MSDIPLVPGAPPGTVPGQLPLPGANPAPGTPPPAPTVPDPPPEPAGITLSNAQLTERLDRAKASERKALLKSMGFESEEALRASVKAAEDARQAQLTAEQRLNEQLATERARADKAETELTEARFTARLTQLCAARGIVDMDYARYLVEQAAGGQDNFDAGVFLDQQLQNPQRKLALGVSGPPVVVNSPTTNSPVNPNLAPPAPAPPNGQNGPVDTMKMSATEFKAYERSNYQS